MQEFFLDLLGDLTLIIEQYNYWIIFFLMTIESSFVPFPSELVMIPAGYLVAKGKLSFALVVLSGIAGSLAGAFINYYLAKFLGIKFIKQYGKYFFFGEKQLNKTQDFFQKHGVISTFTGRLIPGLRQYISIPAGLSGMCQKKFSACTFLGSGIWMLVLTLIGMLFGHSAELIKANLKIATIITVVSIASLIIAYILWQKRRS